MNYKKTVKFSKGCYVHKLKSGKLDELHTVFECTTDISSNKCKITNIFSPNPKSNTISIKNVIPQTVLYYHTDCTQHFPLIDDPDHPECPNRVLIPTKRLSNYNLLSKCAMIKPKEATKEQLLLTHTESHTNKIESTQQIALDYKAMLQKKKGVSIQDEKQSESNTIKTQTKTVLRDNEDDVEMAQEDIKKGTINASNEPILPSDSVENNPINMDIDTEKYEHKSFAKFNNSKKWLENEDCEMDENENKNENKNENENNSSDENTESSYSTERVGWFNIDTFYNEYSYRAAKLACGAAIGLVKNIINERCVNGIAIVRPPGHHCERDKVMGFCLYNNVAVAINVIKQRKLCKKVLIVDWDLHHGNGTQNMFMNDEDVLYFSVHRHDNGFFYPSTGKITDDGKGYNVNVPLNKVANARYGDAAYMDIWKCILIPIAMEFEPEIIVISAGFDACIEDPINGNVMAISPPCYGVLCRMLMNVCSKVAVILEGGYELNTMAPAIAYVTWALLRGSIDNLYEYESIDTYNKSQMELYVENTLWYKSIFFEYEFKRFVLDKIKYACINKFYTCNKEYDMEQQQDFTKIERRRIMKQVLTRHRKYWSCLNVFWKYFKNKY